MNLLKKILRSCSLPWMLVVALTIMLLISLNLPNAFISNQNAGPQLPGQLIKSVSTTSEASSISAASSNSAASSDANPFQNITGPCCDQEFEKDVDYLGGDLSAATNIDSALKCCQLCDSDPSCFLWTYAGTVCYKKTANLKPRTASGLISGSSCKPFPTRVEQFKYS